MPPCTMAPPMETAFRKWLSPGLDENDALELVPGLREALSDAGLSSYLAALEAWCEDAGAAFLGEVLEELEAISEELRLSTPQCRQLRRALAGRGRAGGSVSASAMHL